MKRYLDRRDTDYVRDNLIFNYCLGNEQELLIESYIHNNQLDIRFDPRHFYFFMTGTHKKFVKPYTPRTFHDGVSHIYRMYDAMRACMMEHGYDGNVFLIKEDNSKQTGILMSPVRGDLVSPQEMAEKLLAVYNSIARSVNHISTSLAGPFSGYEQIHSAFRAARTLNDLFFFGVRSRVITQEFIRQTSRPCDVTAILANMRKLTNTLCTGTLREALRQIDYLIDEMIAPSYTFLNYAALWAALEDVLGMFETVYPEHVCIEHRELDTFFTLEQYKQWCRETIGSLYAQLEGVRRYSPTLLMVLSFINRNYTNDLSLTQLAEYAYTNASTLSSEFNTEVGMSLSEYVTTLRVKEACRLLRSTDASVSRIAAQAGFSGAKYFREIFKKQMGLSPHQYRQEPQ